MKILKLKFLFLILASIALIYSCKKDNLTSQIEEAPKENIKPSHPVIFNVGDQEVTLRDGETTDAYSKTQLGNIKQNPYTLANMKQAFENIKGSTISIATPTHLQVKFIPSNFEELDELLQTDAFFFDFPIDHEVIQMGDYFQEFDADEYPVLYSTVKSDFNFPNVNYEVLQELFVSPYESMLTAEAFRLTQNTYISPFDDINDDETELNGFAGDCQPGCASFPCCLGGEVACDDDNLPNPDDCPFYDANCFENSNSLAEYLACVEAVIIAANNNSLYEINDCGCEVYKEIRKPGGCINVEDTELVDMQPVRRVKVIMWDKWITDHHSTYTNDNGCWKINDKFYGNAWMWVKFKSDRVKIRGAAKNWKGIWQWKTAVKDYVGKISGPFFNSIAVNYLDVLDISSNNHRYWSAATINNTVHEFHDYANSDGISAPPNNLDILMGRKADYGYALMGTKTAITLEAALLTATILKPLAPLVTLVGIPAGMLYLPDVFIGTNFDESDRLKSLAFHEIAHASHYQKVGFFYWLKVANGEIIAGALNFDEPHGNPNSLFAGHIAMAESWAGFISRTYNHRTYGNSNSIGWPSWQARLERTWNESPMHVPVGLHHDLVDAGIGAEPFVACDEDAEDISGCITITDNVSGFTISQLFDAMGASNIIEYRDFIITNSLSSTNNTTAQVDALIGQY